MPSGRMYFLTPMAPATLQWADGSLDLEPFDSVLVPAQMEGVVLEGEGKALKSGAPDQPSLRAELGYRAEKRRRPDGLSGEYKGSENFAPIAAAALDKRGGKGYNVREVFPAG